MVNVIGSSGKVKVEILGVAETIRNLQAKQKRIIDSTQAEVIQAANYVQQEVQESIIGNRAEPKSVDTGTFGNNIEVDMINRGEYVIQPNNRKYKNNQTVKEVAKFLEYGTTKINPRRHFRNTKLRTTPKIVAKFLNSVNIALK